MPQFDQFSFLNQVSFFFLFFLSFYFFITYYFLPIISYNLKFRKKKITFDNTKKSQITFEKNNIIIFFNNAYNEFCLNYEFFMNTKIKTYNYNQIQKIKISPILLESLMEKINSFLNQRFIFIRKVFN